MLFLNSFDIASAERQAAGDDRPNLAKAVTTVARLAEWADSHSDGWHSWPLPCRAAKKLQEHIQREYVGRYDDRTGEDLTDAELRAALSPVKSFLTRQGVPHAEVIPA